MSRQLSRRESRSLELKVPINPPPGPDIVCPPLLHPHVHVLPRIPETRHTPTARAVRRIIRDFAQSLPVFASASPTRDSQLLHPIREWALQRFSRVQGDDVSAHVTTILFLNDLYNHEVAVEGSASAAFVAAWHSHVDPMKTLLRGYLPPGALPPGGATSGGGPAGSGSPSTTPSRPTAPSTPGRSAGLGVPRTADARGAEAEQRSAQSTDK